MTQNMRWTKLKCKEHNEDDDHGDEELEEDKKQQVLQIVDMWKAY